MKKVLVFPVLIFLVFSLTLSKDSANDSTQVNIVNKPIEVYFSPNGGIRDKIISRINLSKKEHKDRHL